MIDCPANNLMKLLGKRWVLLILKELNEKNKRFNELGESLKISSRTLSKRLKEMEKIKIVGKKSFMEIPPRTEYSLTEAGRELIKNFRNLDSLISKYKIKI